VQRMRVVQVSLAEEHPKAIKPNSKGDR
jgi:hypothetical protein